MTSAPQGSLGFTLTEARVRLGGAEVLRRVNLAAKPGETVAVVGPSGAGKTTLLRLLTGSLDLEDGQVRVGDTNLAACGPGDLRRLRARIGFIHQDLRLVPNLRVSQNVLSGSFGRLGFFQSVRLFLRPSKADLARVHALLERVGMAEKLFARVDQLSGGQAQRVAVARALYQNPGLLLADEPVSSVDPARARASLELLTGICRQENLTLCVSLHDPGLARDLFQRVVGLREGRVVFDSPAAAVTDAQLTALYRLDPDHGV